MTKDENRADAIVRMMAGAANVGRFDGRNGAASRGAIWCILAAVVALGAVAVWRFHGDAGISRDAVPIEIVCDSGEHLKFTRVAGTSRLPVESFLIGKIARRKDKLSTVQMPVFWIADTMVSEGVFADVMGRPVREGRTPNQLLADIEWAEAYEFCSKFTARYRNQMPRGCFASLPTNFEWAHALYVLGRPSAFLESDLGAFLFVGNADGGFLHTLGSYRKDIPEIGSNLDGMVNFVQIGKRERRDFVGIRLVLTCWDQGEFSTEKGPIDNSHVSRGVVLLQHGMYDESQSVLESTLKYGKLSGEQRKRAKDALAFGKSHREVDIEDWGGLVARTMEYADRRGFVAKTLAPLWGNPSVLDNLRGMVELADYAEAGIHGKWVRIGDLPKEMRESQTVGEKYNLYVSGKGESHTTVEYVISDDTKVQVIECDFTGDGRADFVVEEFGNVGSLGYWYDFWETLPDGSHMLRETLQTVGMCTLPPKNGGACGFAVLQKASNPVLVSSLLTFKGGEAALEPACERPVAMADAHDDRIYANAPFIGAGYGLGWKMLEGHFKVFFRPVFWPWEPGAIQGLPEEGEVQ